MRKRAMRLSAAMFGGAVAGLTLAAIPETAARADDCLAAPDRQSEQGSQWRYRIDRATNRHCWYLKSDDQEAALGSSPSTPAALPAGTAFRRSVTNAHAELAPVRETVQPAEANGLSMADIVDSDITAGNAPLRAAAGRRPDYADAMDLAEVPPSNLVTGPRHRPQPALYGQSGHTTAGSIRTLLSALVGAMALVGGATAVVTQFGRKAIGRRKKRGRERAIWNARPNTNGSTPASAPVRSGDESATDWIRMARQNEEASRQAEQIEQLLSRAARRSVV